MQHVSMLGSDCPTHKCLKADVKCLTLWTAFTPRGKMSVHILVSNCWLSVMYIWQCASRYWSTTNCGNWVSECWKILPHRIYLRYHAASGRRHLYSVGSSEACCDWTTDWGTSRCPTECRLAHSDTQWKCTVSLRFSTDASGAPLGQTRNENFGPPIYNKNEVEDRIRRAQRAILNPSKPVKDFLNDEDVPVEKTELSFSHNCVSLQISGPDVADLSFCDLPGTVRLVLHWRLQLTPKTWRSNCKCWTWRQRKWHQVSGGPCYVLHQKTELHHTAHCCLRKWVRFSCLLIDSHFLIFSLQLISKIKVLTR